MHAVWGGVATIPLLFSCHACLWHDLLPSIQRLFVSRYKIQHLSSLTGWLQEFRSNLCTHSLQAFPLWLKDILSFILRLWHRMCAWLLWLSLDSHWFCLAGSQRLQEIKHTLCNKEPEEWKEAWKFPQMGETLTPRESDVRGMASSIHLKT